MDYVAAGWPSDLIRNRLQLSAEQLAAALEYIREHRQEVEAEYEQVVREAEESRRYWEVQDRERKRERTPAPERQALRARLAAWKKKRTSA
jgi:phage terminase Nu1 subunit (DNA packaging protein)